MARRLNLTKKGIEALPTVAGKRIEYHDAKIPGLGVVVRHTGTKQFFWFRRVRGRRTWKTLGTFPATSVEQARTLAQKNNTKLDKWKSSEFDGPSPFAPRRSGLTLAAVLEDYVAKHVRRKAARPDDAARAVRWQMRYLSSLANRRLGEINRQDVRTLHDDVGKRHGHVTANRAVSLLRRLFYWAIDEELWHGENPARRVKLFHERSRERFVQPEELPTLLAHLSVEPNDDVRDFVKLALLTGARRGDILAMRWQDVSIAARSWRIPHPKSGTPYVVPLMDEALAILEGRRNDSQWVFPSASAASGHVVSVKRGWRQLVKRAGLKDLRVHDLRRTLGSWMAATGESLPIIGRALGHKSLGATQVYAKLQLDTVRNAVERATRAMLTALEPEPKQLKEGAS